MKDFEHYVDLTGQAFGTLVFNNITNSQPFGLVNLKILASIIFFNSLIFKIVF